MRNYQEDKNIGLYEPQYEHDNCGVGFVCNITGKKTHKIVSQGITVLNRLSHRGAVGADPKTGDGAGLLIQIPHEFFLKELSKTKIRLPKTGDYAVGLIFLPKNKADKALCKKIFVETIEENGQYLLGWRKVPVNNQVIGLSARETEPSIEQIFIKRNASLKEEIEFERKLYLIRKKIENKIRKLTLKEKSFFYITNLSCRTLTYKGLLMPEQVEEFFYDLKNSQIKSSLCLIHSRYSTNTFPSWDLAQPFRYLAHNGEINTLRGNINWTKARERTLEHAVFGKDIKNLKPILTPQASDSATIDNMAELLYLSGRPLSHTMMMLIPQAWENNKLLSSKLKAFYKYHACFSEPWDGPAAIAFTDGKNIGSILDRNGLRPVRYIITKDKTVVMASEVGVLDIPGKDITRSARLQPGEMLLIDTEKQTILSDKEIKKNIANQRPYEEWVRNNLLELDSLPVSNNKEPEIKDNLPQLTAFGYSREDIKTILSVMAESAKEPTGSMGNDTPLAVLSHKPQILYNYFKQLFAQVTNPAIDPIRENIVMSLDSFLGRQENILAETPFHCHKLHVKNPVLKNKDLMKIKELDTHRLKTKTISILFNRNDYKSFKKTLKDICLQAEKAVKREYAFIILSDRGTNKNQAAIPALLATASIHHYLIRKTLRTQIGIIIESAEPRETHHFALLFGYGADCINPYLAYSTITNLSKQGLISLTPEKALENYSIAINKGLKKILSKMGISTLQSYRGAQIFEALGIDKRVIERCFTGTTSRIGGIGFKEIFTETIARHKKAFSQDVDKKNGFSALEIGGIYQWRKEGEFHLWNPESIYYLQRAARNNNNEYYQRFSRIINNQSKNPTTLRGLLEFKETDPIPISEVEPAKNIFKRLATGAMSYGSISGAAHQNLAIAMNRIGGKSNTGEGGEDPARFESKKGQDSRNSAIKQVASGRFGVTTNYLANAKEIQIKIAQGAKPGEGGQLPGHKVSVTIAKTRYTTPGVTLISPPPHHDIYSIEDLAQLIFDLKNSNPKARISVKLVSEIGVGTIAAGVAKGHADMILISGGHGGTGASPKSSIRHAGLPWELGLSETHQTLVLNNLRNRVRLQTDGQMRTGKDIAIAALLGAEEYGFCTAALIVSGCTMLRHCHLNNCSLGVATQNKELEKRFTGKPEYVVNYLKFVVDELRQIMAQLGIRTIDEMIGRTDLLAVNSKLIPPKAKNIDFSRILYKPKPKKHTHSYCTEKQDHKINKVLDQKLVRLAKDAIKDKKHTELSLKINNTNRTTGTMLSHYIVKEHGEPGLPPDTLTVNFKGVAGQSFGAWLSNGVTFKLEGLANDYVGKGISGGKIIIHPYKDAQYKANTNAIIGNTTFYGAIKGAAFIRGKAGERFCIRNSGLKAVVEGIGEHGCEYMTGGRVVILGEVGRNFAAGMSGGIAFIYDKDKELKQKCNLNMVEIEPLDNNDKSQVLNLVKDHFKYTNSPVAEKIIKNFKKEITNFKKVMPLEYKRILAQTRKEKDFQEVSK